MRFRYWLPLLWMAFAGDSTAFRVIGPSEHFPNEIWIESVTPPVFAFKVVEGPIPPAKAIAMCKQTTALRRSGDHQYRVLTLECEGGSKLELMGIDFGGAK